MFFVLPFFFEVPFVVVICLHCFDLSSEQGKIKCHQLGHHFFFKWTCSHVNSPSLFFCCSWVFLLYLQCLLWSSIFVNCSFISFFCLQGMARKCHHHAPSWNTINYMYFICNNGYMPHTTTPPPPRGGMLLHVALHFLVVIKLWHLQQSSKRDWGLGGGLLVAIVVVEKNDL